MSGDNGSDLIVTVDMPPIFWSLWTIGGKSLELLLDSSDDEFYPDVILTDPKGPTNCVNKHRRDSTITTGVARVTIGRAVIEIYTLLRENQRDAEYCCSVDSDTDGRTRTLGPRAKHAHAEKRILMPTMTRYKHGRTATARWSGRKEP